MEEIQKILPTDSCEITKETIQRMYIHNDESIN